MLAWLLGPCQATELFPLLFLSDVMESIAGACSAGGLLAAQSPELGQGPGEGWESLPRAGPAFCGPELPLASALLCLVLL